MLLIGSRINQTKTKLSQVLRESITGKAIVILLGSIIGYIIGKDGLNQSKLFLMTCLLAQL